MILKANEHIVKLPERVEYSTTYLIVYNNDPEKDPNAIGYPIQKVQYGQVIIMTPEQKKIRGLPLSYCIYFDGEMVLYPAPDKDYYAKFRYCPAMKEI